VGCERGTAEQAVWVLPSGRRGAAGQAISGRDAGSHKARPSAACQVPAIAPRADCSMRAVVYRHGADARWSRAGRGIGLGSRVCQVGNAVASAGLSEGQAANVSHEFSWVPKARVGIRSPSIFSLGARATASDKWCLCFSVRVLCQCEHPCGQSPEVATTCGGVANVTRCSSSLGYSVRCLRS